MTFEEFIHKLRKGLKVDQEISNLLNPKEQKNESERPENVIKFGRDTEK